MMPINGFTYPGNGTNPYPINSTTPIQQPVQPQVSMQSMILVNSEQEALNWAMAPGNTLFFMNSNEKVFYIKTADFSGMTSFRKFKFEEIDDASDKNDVVTREEFELFKASIQKDRNNHQQRKGEKING